MSAFLMTTSAFLIEDHSRRGRERRSKIRRTSPECIATALYAAHIVAVPPTAWRAGRFPADTRPFHDQTPLAPDRARTTRRITQRAGHIHPSAHSEAGQGDTDG